MLLEVLSDFQISIPELGRVQSRTHPVVLLTSNNSRELTEALKRRCLYLWLDYPELEHELEIVRLHAPELSETVARRLVEVSAWCASSTSRSRRRSPSRSTGRARCCCSASRTSTPTTFTETMSVIVKHRTDMDVVAERVGLKLALARRCRLSRRRRPPEPAGRRRACPRGSSSSARSCAAKASRSAPPSCSTPSRCCARSAGPTQEDFREALAATLAKSQEDRRVFELVFERFFFRAVEIAASREGVREEDLAEPRRAVRRASSTRCARRSRPRCATARRARCATSRGWRSPPSPAARRARA